MEDGESPGAWDRRAPDVVAGPATPSFASRLDRWVADARADDAAAQRARERWLRSVAEQEATFTGVLLDLAERSAGIAVTTTAGRRLVGAVEAIGADFVALRVAAGRQVLVALAAISVIRTAPSVEDTVGDRVVTAELTLAEALAGLAADGARVLVVSPAGAESVAGTLRSVGQDVVVLRTDAEPAASAYVPLAAISEVVLG